jgi:pre-mRNA-splicing factor ATP-dependent RNA helicase DHX38/PRP16
LNALLAFLLLSAEAAGKQGGEADYKGESKFATHLKNATSTSAFSRTRTLKEQREYLPAFACREDLMKMLRDFQGLFLVIPPIFELLTVPRD